MPVNLINLLRHRYLDTIQSVRPPSRWKIVVVDRWTKDMIGNVLKMYDILEQGVQQVEQIDQHRSPNPRLEAIYFLVPTSENVERLIRDFSAAPPPPQPQSGSHHKLKRSADPPPQPPASPGGGMKYAAAHVFFIDAIDDRQAQRLTSAIPQGCLKSFVELYINFWPLEAQVFSLKTPQTFQTLYAPPERTPREGLEKWEEELGFMSRSLVNTLATLGEFPLIRYYNPQELLGPAKAAGISTTKRLATRLQREMEEYRTNNPGFPPKADPPRPQGVMFITDRTMDLHAPFLHEFTYQAMCNDLLDIEDGKKYHYSFREQDGHLEEKDAELTDDDQVWTEIRHQHMKEALDKLVADFKQYAGEHGSSFGSSNQSSLNDVKDMLATLPHMKEQKEKLSLHLTMAEKCMGLFETKKLPMIAHVEQCCATGETPDGRTPKTLVEDMVPLLDDRSVSPLDKLRVIALYIMYRDGVPEEDRKRLYQHARLALHEMDAVNNLTYLGVNVGKDTGKKRKPLFKHPGDRDSYEISRFQPNVQLMLEEHFNSRLDQNLFPYVADAPTRVQSSTPAAAAAGGPGSLRSSRPRWQNAKGGKPANEARQRAIVFVAGGMTYSEIRSIYQLSESASRDIVIGSTHVWTPKSFTHELAQLDRAGGASISHTHPSLTYEAFDPNHTKKGEAPLGPRMADYDSRYSTGMDPSQVEKQPNQQPVAGGGGKTVAQYQQQAPMPSPTPSSQSLKPLNGGSPMPGRPHLTPGGSGRESYSSVQTTDSSSSGKKKEKKHRFWK